MGPCATGNQHQEQKLLTMPQETHDGLFVSEEQGPSDEQGTLQPRSTTKSLSIDTCNPITKTSSEVQRRLSRERTMNSREAIFDFCNALLVVVITH